MNYCKADFRKKNFAFVQDTVINCFHFHERRFHQKCNYTPYILYRSYVAVLNLLLKRRYKIEQLFFVNGFFLKETMYNFFLPI